MNRFLTPLMACLLGACGGAAPPAPVSPAPPSSPSTPTVGDSAHDLAMLATACWFGGMWGDKPTTDQDCAEVVKRVYATDDKGRLERLRAYDEGAIADVAAKVSAKASADPKEASQKDALVAIVKSFAAAQRELMLARRAADKIKRDLKRPESESEKEKLSADEAAAIGPLKKIDALSALLALDAGPLKTDAHTLGLLTALERITLSGALPVHVKLYACSGPLALLFGVQPPAASEEADKPLPPGTWVNYMLAVAKGAGHPVADVATERADRMAFAWSGVYLGLATKLRADEAQLSERGQLRHVEGMIVTRLEKDAKGLQAKHVPKN